MIRRQGAAEMALEAGSIGQAGDRGAGDRQALRRAVILQPFDLRVLRGDRVAFVGPNGAGKTTLLNMLTASLAPDEGSVTLGTGIEMAVLRTSAAGGRLDAEATALVGSLTGGTLRAG